MINKKLRGIRKSSSLWLQYTQLKDAVVAHILSRPIDEQLRLMTTNVDKLLESTSRLVDSAGNMSKANELAIENCIINHLSKQFDEVSPAQIVGGAIIGTDGNRIVQWDSILRCKKGGDNLVVYFTEVKEIPHANDIVATEERRSLDLASKVQRTEMYFKQLENINDTGRAQQFIDQNYYLRPFINRKRVYVYASGRMHDDVIKRLHSLVPIPGVSPSGDVSLAYAQCEHYSDCVLIETNDSSLA